MVIKIQGIVGLLVREESQAKVIDYSTNDTNLDSECLSSKNDSLFAKHDVIKLEQPRASH